VGHGSEGGGRVPAGHGDGDRTVMPGGHGDAGQAMEETLQGDRLPRTINGNYLKKYYRSV